MKRTARTMIAVLFFMLLSDTSLAQSATSQQTTVIDSYPLKISKNKTTHLIFPFAIKSVDRGSGDVLAQKAKGVENILLLKAGKEDFSQTNLGVITADGKLYSFMLDYVENPATLNISFSADSIASHASNSIKPLYNEAITRLDAEKISKEKKRIRGVRDDRYDVTLSLHGIYIKDDVIFFKVEVLNISNINYDVDMLRFFIKDEKKLKRTASQEVEVLPVHVNGDTSAILSGSKNTIVFAMRKFTIPDRQYLSVQLMEDNGGRNLQLSIRNRKITKAKSL